MKKEPNYQSALYFLSLSGLTNLATKRYVELTSYPAEDFRFASVIFNKILFLE